MPLSGRASWIATDSVCETDRELRGHDQLAQVAVADVDVLQVGVLVTGGDVAHLRVDREVVVAAALVRRP